MSESSTSRLGGACAALLGVSYLLVAVTFFADFLRGDVLFVLGAVCAFGAVPAISKAAGSGASEWVGWAARLAYVGFATVAVRNASTLTLEPNSPAYENPGIDDLGWLTYGAVGAWLLIVNVVALRHRTWPRALSYAGLGASIAYFAAPLLDTIELFAGASPASAAVENGIAVVGGLVLGPLWYIWHGIRLWRRD